MKYTMQINEEQKEEFKFGAEEGEHGGGGTDNYNDLSNRPSINGNILTGNKTSAQLGIVDLTQLEVAASAQEIEAGQTAEASVSLVNKLMTFLFKIPKGDKGDKGDTGATGATGPQGPIGPQGPEGPQGATGATGPTGANGQNGADGVTPNISVNATVDANTGTPSVDVTKSGTDANPTFTLAFHNLKGEGGSGGSSDITATASVGNTTGTPSVNVTKTTSGNVINFDFAFSNIKGAKGETGATGATGETGPQGPVGPQGPKGDTGATGATGPAGTNGTNGADGVTPNITVNATVDNNTGTPSVDVTKSGTKEAPVFNFAFHNLKGEGGSGGSETQIRGWGAYTAGGHEINLDNYDYEDFITLVYINRNSTRCCAKLELTKTELRKFLQKATTNAMHISRFMYWGANPPYSSLVLLQKLTRTQTGTDIGTIKIEYELKEGGTALTPSDYIETCMYAK